MGKDRKLEVLELLEKGEISAEEALELLDSIALYNEMKYFKSTVRKSKSSDQKLIELQ